MTARRKPEPPPKYSYRVRWRRANHEHAQSRFYERLWYAEAFARREAAKTWLAPLIEMSLERRVVGPWLHEAEWDEVE